MTTMIENDQQYQIAKSSAELFKKSINESISDLMTDIDPIIQSSFREALKSKLHDIEKDLLKYESSNIINACPKCKSTAHLVYGDCGYSSFNVAFIICKNCKIKMSVHSDFNNSVIQKWNNWCKEPLTTLIDEILLNCEKSAEYESIQEYSGKLIKQQLGTL